LRAFERLAAGAHAVAVSAGEATAQAGPFVTFTLVTGAFTDMALSWLCNVRALDAPPNALVFAAADEDSYDRRTAAVAAASCLPPAVGGGVERQRRTCGDAQPGGGERLGGEGGRGGCVRHVPARVCRRRRRQRHLTAADAIAADAVDLRQRRKCRDGQPGWGERVGGDGGRGGFVRPVPARVC